MLKLTRLNNHVIAINPDHISLAEAMPDTTLFLLGGERIIVRESLEELIALIVRYRRAIREGTGADSGVGPIGDPPVSVRPSRPSGSPPLRPSMAPFLRGAR